MAHDQHFQVLGVGRLEHLDQLPEHLGGPGFQLAAAAVEEDVGIELADAGLRIELQRGAARRKGRQPAIDLWGHRQLGIGQPLHLGVELFSLRLVVGQPLLVQAQLLFEVGQLLLGEHQLVFRIVAVGFEVFDLGQLRAVLLVEGAIARRCRIEIRSAGQHAAREGNQQHRRKRKADLHDSTPFESYFLEPAESRFARDGAAVRLAPTVLG